MSLIAYVLSFAFLGLVICLVVTATREEDIANAPRKAVISFGKLAVLSVAGILLVEALYYWVWLTYPVLAVLFVWLFFGDRLWRRMNSKQSANPEAARTQGS